MIWAQVSTKHNECSNRQRLSLSVQVLYEFIFQQIWFSFCQIYLVWKISIFKNILYESLEIYPIKTKQTKQNRIAKSSKISFSYSHNHLGYKLHPNVFCHCKNTLSCLLAVIFKTLLLWPENVENHIPGLKETVCREAE